MYRGFTNNYEELAEKAGLGGMKRFAYIKYMTKRWPEGVDYLYGFEWATRFSNDMEWHSSDKTGRMLLQTLGYAGKA